MVTPSEGIKTTDDMIEKYIEDVFSQIRARKDLFLNAFATPILRNPLDVLSNLQRLDHQGDFEGMDMSQSLVTILNVELYLSLERAKSEFHEAMRSVNAEPDDNNDVVSEAEHIHNKVIFDAVNEALNNRRPYGAKGEPMPWSKKSRKNPMFMVGEEEQALEAILRDVKIQVMQWTTTKAGMLPPRLVDGEGNVVEGTNGQVIFDEELFHLQREKMLMMLLGEELYENEPKWLDYEMEEAQVKIDLGDIVLEHLVGECVDDLHRLQKRTFA